MGRGQNWIALAYAASHPRNRVGGRAARLPKGGKVAKKWPPWLSKVAKSWQRCQGLCVVNVALWYCREIGSHNRLASKQLRYGRDNARGGQMAQSIALSLGTLNRAFLNQARILAWFNSCHFWVTE